MIHFFLLAGLLISFLPGRAWSNSAPVTGDITTAEPSARPPGRLVVSILWFEDKTGDPQTAHWRYAIKGMLSNQFRQTKAVRLRGGVESARKRLEIAKGAALNADQARKMGEIIEAQRVIWGSLRHQGDAWQVTAQVLNVASGKASIDLTTASADFFEVCDDLTDQILKELNVIPSDAERKKMERPLTSSITAWEWYSKAHALREESKPLPELEDCARKAITADPNFAEAFGALAAMLATQGKFEPAEGAVRQALTIKPDYADAHRILGFVLLHQKRYVETEKEIREANRLDPDNIEALSQLGGLHATQGKFDEAIDAFNQAKVLEPMNASIHASLGYAYTFKGDRDQAMEELKKAEHLDPGGLENINTEQMICQAYDRLNEIPLAVKHYDRFIRQAKKQGLNPEVIRVIEQRATKLKETLTATFLEYPMPKVYTEQMLQETLETKLTKEELAMVVNPLASNQDIKRWALQLIEGVNSEMGKARAIFDGLARRISLINMHRMRTAQEVFAACNDPNESFNCQESAKLYIALARDAGLKAFYTIVDEDYNSKPVSHACAAVFVDGKALLVDLSYRWFGAPHKKVVILDDMQTITSQLCEAAATELNRSFYRLAVKLHPDVALSQFALATALANEGEWQEARRMTEAARQHEPEHWKAYFMQGLLSRKDGDLDAAVNYFRKVSAIKTDDAVSRYCLGDLLMAQLKFKEAREEFRAGLQYDPEHSMAKGARQAIALINESLGEETAQISNDPNVYLIGAQHYLKEGSYDQAIVQLNKALSIDPELAGAYYGRGRAYYEKQQYEQAILDFTKVIEINPQHTMAYEVRGGAYAVNGQYDKAISDFTKNIELNPEHTQAYGGRGAAYTAKGQYDQAISDLTKAIEKNPQITELYLLRGTAYSGKGDFKSAIDDYNRASVPDSRIPPAHFYWRGLAYLKNGDNDRAISDFKRALEVNKEDTKSIVGLATAIMNKDMHILAISLLGRAIELDSQFAEAYAVRARACYKNDQFEECRKDVKAAQELGYEFEPAFLDSVRNAAGNKQ